MRSFNGVRPGEGFFAELPARWKHPTGVPPNGVRLDDFPGETERFSRTSGHPVADPDRAVAVEQLFWTPFADTVTLAFARILIEEEGLYREIYDLELRDQEEAFERTQAGVSAEPAPAGGSA